MKIHAAIFAAVFCVTSALAGEVELPIGRALAVHAALVEISAGSKHIVKENGEDKPVSEQFDLSSATRLVIAKNILRLEDVYAKPMRDLQTAWRTLCAVEMDKCKEPTFLREAQAFDALNVKVDIIPLSEVDLRLDRNQISPTAIAGIMPLLQIK